MGARTITRSAPDPEPPRPTELAGLKLAVLRRRRDLNRARRGGAGPAALAGVWVSLWLARLTALFPVRVLLVYILRRGPLMAAGMSFRMFFSITSLLLVGFSVFGIVLGGNAELRDKVLDIVARSVPGLLSTPERGGLVDPAQVLASGDLGRVGVVAAAVALYMSLSWISSLRAGFRTVFSLPAVKLNIVLLKLRDVGVLLALGIALIVTSALSVLVNLAMDAIIDFLHLNRGSVAPLIQAAGLLVILALDYAVAVIIFIGAAGIRLPSKVLWQAALVSAVGTSILRILGTNLLGGATRNPLLASFAIILGLLIWFNLMSQVFLVAASWGAVLKSDYAAAVRRAAKGERAQSLRQRSRLARKHAKPDGGP